MLVDTSPILLPVSPVHNRLLPITLPTLLHSPPLSSTLLHSPPNFSPKLLPGSSRPPAGSGQPLNMSLPNSNSRCHSHTSLQSTFQTPSRDVTPKVAPACHSQVRSQVRSSMSLPNFISKCLSQSVTPNSSKSGRSRPEAGKGLGRSREGAGKESGRSRRVVPSARPCGAP